MTHTFAQVPCVLLADKSGSEIAMWIAIAVIVFMITVGKNRTKTAFGCASDKGTPRKCGGTLKWLFVSLAVMFLMAVLVGVASYVESTERSARHERARQSAGAEQAAKSARAAEDITLKKWPIHDAWDELHKPRIDLKLEDGTMKSIAVPISPESTDSLVRSIERVEAAAERVTKVADQMMSIGTLVGRALVVVNGSLGASSSAAVKADATAETKPAAAAVSANAADPQIEVVEDIPSTPADVPAWIDDPPKHVGNLWREVLVTDEFATDEECRHQANGLLLKATYDYIRQISSYPGALVDSRETETWSSESPVYTALTRMGIGIDFIRREIAKDEYTETVQRSFGPMRKNYTLIEFSSSLQSELRQRFEEYLRRERFAAIGLGAGSVLGLLGLAYGLLKADTWTKGYYSKRLFLGVPAAIIGAIVAVFTWKEVIF